MIDTSEKEITTVQAARGIPWGSGPGVLIGLLFLLVGSGILAMHFLELASPPMPLAVAIAFGGTFTIVGIAVAVLSIGATVRDRRRQRRMRAHPGEPWFVDHAWDRSGTRADDKSNAAGCLFYVTCLSVALVPFLGRTAAFVLAIPLALVVATLGRALLHRARYGRRRLEFATFPFFLGEAVEGRLDLPGARFEKVTLTLRAIDERLEAGVEPGSTTVNVYQVWAESLEIPGDALPRRPRELPVRFDLPDDGPETSLSGEPPTYWELWVRGHAPVIDYQAHFLLPVYRGPR